MQIALLLMLVFGVSACSKPQFGRSYNKDRMERELPVISAEWITGNVWGSETMWKLPGWDSTSGKAAHTGKKVAYHDGKRIWEEDYYYSGRTFDGSIIDPDSGTAWEEITVHYDYSAPENPWRCHVVSDRHGGLTSVDLQEAEKILHSWGLKRLNYNSKKDAAGQPPPAPSRNEPGD